jgi:preprotein translocase subunit Sss1
MFGLVIPRLPVQLATVALIVSFFYVAESGADTFKCIDSRGRVSYTDVPCPSDTRIEKRIGDLNPTTRVAPPAAPSDPDKSDRYMSRFTSPSSPAITAGDRLRQSENSEAREGSDLERMEQEEILREIAHHARQESEARARAIAEQATHNFRNEMLRSSIKTKNSTYFGALLLGTIGFLIYLIKRHNNKAKTMEANQKYGVVTMVISFLLVLLALVISDGWIPQFDYVENLMNFLRIQLFEINNEYGGSFCLVDVRTKYVALAFLCLGAYGFTTYIGITPAFKPWTVNWLKGSAQANRE